MNCGPPPLLSVFGLTRVSYVKFRVNRIPLVDRGSATGARHARARRYLAACRLGLLPQTSVSL